MSRSNTPAIVATVHPVFWFSAGVAQVNTKVTGMMPGFSVTDTVDRVGGTFAVGAGIPFNPWLMGTVQYRGTVLPSGNVSIPGNVEMSRFWAQGLTIGLEVRY